MCGEPGFLPGVRRLSAQAAGGRISVKAFRHSRWSRLGAAFGLLAVLALAALAPIHHVHAIQRDFGGFAPPHQAQSEGCHTAASGHAHHAPADQPAKPPIYCPICSLGKMAGVLLPPNLPILAAPVVGRDGPAPAVVTPVLVGRTDPAARPRAPPVHA